MGGSGTTTIFLLSPVDVDSDGMVGGGMACVCVGVACVSEFIA